MGIETKTQTVDQIPELNEVWENSPEHLILEKSIVELSINPYLIFPNKSAVGFFGGQKGDEAKGTWNYRLTHIKHIKGQGGASVRSGGPGAGHEFLPDGANEEITMRMLPTAVDDDWIKIAGRAELVNPDIIIDELDILKKSGFNPTPLNVMIDGAATLAWDAHKLRDAAEESLRGNDAVGTTKSGVGPAAADYTARNDLRISILQLPSDEMKVKVLEKIDLQNRILEAYGSNMLLDPQETLEKFNKWSKLLNPYIQNTYPVVHDFLKNESLTYEAAQAFGISLDTGFPGSVTSTDSGPGTLERRYRTSRDYLGWRFGVIKLVPTAVGKHLNHSPLPEKYQDMLYQRTAERGKPETGRVSGRRRMYYNLSIPELRAASQVYGLNGWLLSKVDAADVLPKVHFGMEYVFPDGMTTSNYDPDNPKMQDSRTRMNMLEMDGWQKSTAGLTRFEDAPKELRAIVGSLTELTKIPVVAIGTGPKFGEAIYAKNSPFDILELQ